MDHSFFIWCAYGVSALILSWTAIAPSIRHRRAVREQEGNTTSANDHDAHA